VGDAMQKAARWLIALALAVAVEVIAASASAAPEPGTAVSEARLEIDTSAAGPGADVLHRRIEERANVVLRHAKVLPGDQDDVVLGIVVRELVGDEPGYALTLELHAADGSPLGEPTRLECRLCTETELVARVEAELETTVSTLRELGESTAQPDESMAQPDSTPARDPEHSPVDDTTDRRPGAGMLAGGITLLVVGGAGLGTGVGLAIPEPRIDEDDPLYRITTRPIGYALLAGGVALAVGGAVLTALAVKRRRSPQWSLAPYGGRDRVGVVMGWTF
jgi:hypothetical protein